MTETITKLKLKYGEIEFEIEGSPETVAKEREEFQKTLIPAMEAFLQRRKTTYIQEPIFQEKELPANDTKLISCTHTHNKNFANFAHFLKEKNFTTDVDKVIAAVYYISEICNKDIITRDDIEQEFKNAKQPNLTNLSAAIAVNIKKAHMEELEKVDNKRTFRILQPGIDYCNNYIPKEENSKKSTKGIKHSKAKQQKDYPSLAITVDELHMDKYCDITKLQKFAEQIWVLMHMYTEETQFNSFTKQELQRIMKEKFNLPASDKQIRTFFENAGKDVDKVKIGKELSIRLLLGGKQKAENIINKHKS